MFQIAPSSDWRTTRLFCFPHAGGGPSAFRGWRDQLGPDLEAVIVQLPGRESRFREKPYLRMEPLVCDLADAIIPYLANGQKFAFFGNSLGGLIAYETLHAIKRRTGSDAIHFFVSASGAPHTPSPLPPMGYLNDRELVREVSERYGGIPALVLEDEEFLAALLPTLRADIQMLEAYKRSLPEPLSCPITAFAGARDMTVPVKHLEAWSDQTTSSFTKIVLDEDHLYLQSARKTLTATIRETLVSAACAR
jgi:medium-chain acyl-[acyl-carrier-protein] hydrolase